MLFTKQKYILNNIDYIQNKGFQIKGRYIFKRSESNNRQKVVGQLNENNFFFYSENVYPFKSGINYFDNSTIVDQNYTHYIKEARQNESTDFDVSFEKYIEVTKEKSIFTDWLNKETNNFLNRNAKNYFDLRGVYSGYMEHSVCFPFIDIDGNFITAQIIKYDSKGSRVKSQFSTNWFHSYKNIKKNLELKDNYSVPVKCFFGENYLKDSDNIVAIVEAPKTASILKEVYPNIDWLATAGETQISNKNLCVLENRTVILFPDAHTSLWSDFAKENNFYCSNVLNIDTVKKGDDIADHIFNAESSVYSEIHNQLTGLSDGVTGAVDSYDKLELNYQIVGKEQGYFTIINPNYKKERVLLSLDNASEYKVVFRDKLFSIYEKEFVKEENKLKGYEIYSAQIDWHRPVIDKGGFRQMNETEFIFSLQGCFRILKALNPKIYLEVFERSLINFKDSNYSFNKDYVLNNLVKQWDNCKRDLSIFKKVRDWRFAGTKSLTRNEFVKELNNSRYRANLDIKAKALYDVLGENRFIDIETDLLIKSKYNTFRKLTDLAKEWNEYVIGAKTYKSFVNKGKVERCTKNTAVHISSNIYTAVKNVQSNFNYSKVSEITGIKNRNTIKYFLEFEADEDVRKRIIDDVFFILKNVHIVEPIRQVIGRKGIIDFEIEIVPVKDTSVYSQAIPAEQAFASLKELKKLLSDKKKNLSEIQVEVIEDEIKYLLLLDKIKDLSDMDKEKMQLGNFRKSLINTFLLSSSKKDVKTLLPLHLKKVV
tara:strand:- start:278 stop:2575 length:2298 start_codon:yes stop_codon:yes gene_type:complete